MCGRIGPTWGAILLLLQVIYSHFYNKEIKLSKPHTPIIYLTTLTKSMTCYYINCKYVYPRSSLSGMKYSAEVNKYI